MSTASFLNLTIETTLECNINELSVNYFYQSYKNTIRSSAV